MTKILVTGAAGFIGFHLCRALCARGEDVAGLDNLNAYYDVDLKRARLAELDCLDNFTFIEADLADRARMEAVFDAERPERVVHLAAQAGVRHGIDHPHAYIDSNLTGFLHILEGCRHHAVKHLVFASSSSVYGANEKTPFNERDPVNHPVSLYAATKKSNELMAHSYAHLFGIPMTGLRFFTVYGPWGRPDMAVYKFTRALFAGEPIDVYNNGHMKRDFTYIDDIIEGVVRIIDRPAAPDPAWSGQSPDPATSYAPYRLYNIGHNNPVALGEMITILEEETGLRAQKVMRPMQPGDVPETYADVDDLAVATGFRPATDLREGLRRFVAWYRTYHGNMA